MSLLVETVQRRCSGTDQVDGPLADQGLGNTDIIHNSCKQFSARDIFLDQEQLATLGLNAAPRRMAQYGVRGEPSVLVCMATQLVGQKRKKQTIEGGEQCSYGRATC